MTRAVRLLWAEPRAPHPPPRVWRDWALVAVLVPVAVLEGLLRDNVEWRPVAIGVSLALLLSLLWRRTEPLAAVAVAFGALIVVALVSAIGADEPVGLDSTLYVVLLPYSLFRWGSGREVAIGLGFILGALVIGLASDWTGIGDAVGGTVFLLFPAMLGASVRYWMASRLRELDHVKLREREQLARELHDTVAHHVSAIAVRAQAGRVLAANEPAAAVDALEVIEEEASLTLAEMRVMVGALRDGGEPELAPGRGLVDVQRLAYSFGDSPRVAVELTGALDDLRPAIEAAIYRLARESITNAVRHARDATCIEVRIAGDDDSVRLIVRDDGGPGSFGAGSAPGYGLVGMAERTALLGGTLEAGPSPSHGWTVTAMLPKSGTAA